MSINDRITKKVNEAKSKHKKEISKFIINIVIYKIDDLRRNYEGQLNQMQAALSSVKLEISTIKETHKIDEKAIRQRVEMELRNQFESEFEIRFKEKDEEKAELFDQIHELKDTLEHYKVFVTNYYTACNDKNWEELMIINNQVDEISDSNDIVKQMLYDINNKMDEMHEEDRKTISNCQNEQEKFHYEDDQVSSNYEDKKIQTVPGVQSDNGNCFINQSIDVMSQIDIRVNTENENTQTDNIPSSSKHIHIQCEIIASSSRYGNFASFH